MRTKRFSLFPFDRGLFKRSLGSSLSFYLSMFSAAVAIAIAGPVHGFEFILVIGYSATVSNAVRIATGGLHVRARRAALSAARANPGPRIGLLPKELGPVQGAAVFFSLVIAILWMCGVSVLSLFDGGVPRLLFFYWLFRGPALMILPWVSVVSGLSAPDSVSRQLVRAVSPVSLIGIVSFCSIWAGWSAETTICAIGSVYAVTSSSSLVSHWRRFVRRSAPQGSRRLEVLTLFRGSRGWRSEAWRSFKGSVDGLVLMTVFSLSIQVAGTYSVPDGAAVAAGVSVMRTFVIPARRFGFVAGSEWLEQSGKGPAGGCLVSREDSVKRAVACSIPLFWGLAAVLLLVDAAGIIGPISLLMVSLMALQLVIEPFAGVLYSYLSVAEESARARLVPLCVYSGVLTSLLVCLSLAGHAEAGNVWLAMFVCRALFALLLIGRIRAWARTP
ncbi:hypothetical protein [Arthrobacter sp. UM1]|uniref:hypothetical protein n=1 Tax=Arthrobacter sp. UM1 TaxID=2766776 RepID=UPI001CF6135E|nr:hypothetical protein [Arthrobacter sp. UM1]MCB4208486.1 hypothetical protein [Arthrobacter sp. UM1]